VEPYRERIEEDFLRRWRSLYEGNRVFRVLVITVVLAAVVVTSAGLQQTPTYEASARVWVAQKQGDQQTLPPGGEGFQTIILTMIHTIDSGPIAQEAIQRLGLQMGRAELLDNLTVEPLENTRVIVLTYQSTDPYKAQQIVNTVSEVSSELIPGAFLHEGAKVSEDPVSPHPWSNGFLTLVIGLVLCAGIVVVRPGVGARIAGTLGERPSRQGIGQAEVLGRDRSIVERVKEKKLLLALGRRGKLTAVEAALESELSVEEANRILEELAFAGQLEVTVEHGKLRYSFWGHEAP
jgi:capsular polysaccharide biosynthesis protein